LRTRTEDRIMNMPITRMNERQPVQATWRRKHSRLQSALVFLARNSLGLLFAVGSLFLLQYIKTSSPWGFSLLILIGLVTAWITGKPAGWAIATFSVWLWLSLLVARDYVTTGPYYMWDLMKVIGSHHRESIRHIGPIFSMYLLVGGLLGAGLRAILVAAVRARVNRETSELNG